MHLFKNKTKDVKQFLEQIKANKTNRSSNTNTLEKKHKPPLTTSPEPFHSEYRSNLPPHSKPQHFDSHPRDHSSNYSNQDSNSFRNSVTSNSRSANSIHSAGHNFVQSSPHQQQISHYPQRPSQEHPFYKENTARQVYNDRPPFQQTERFTNFQPVSEPIYDGFSQSNSGVRNQNFYDPTRSHAEHQKPIQPFHPYQSEVQHGYYQAQRNFESSHQDRFTQNFKSNNSQHSNSPTYDQAHIQQSHNTVSQHSRPQSRISHTMQPQIVKPQADFPLLNQKNKNHTGKSIPQFDTRTSMNETQPSTYFKKNEAQRLYTSQMSELNQPMAQICQIDDYFSTENDSPAKLTEFLSKTKYDFEPVEQLDDNQLDQEEKIIKIEEKRGAYGTKINENKRQKTPDFRREKKKSPKRKDLQQKQGKGEKKIASPDQKMKQNLDGKSSHSSEKNILSAQKIQIPQKKEEALAKTEPKTSKIKVGQNQRYRLQKSLHQVDQVHIKLDGILKETQIILNNIRRSDDEFRKMIQSNTLMKEKRRREGLAMEVEEMNVEKEEVGTEKKGKIRTEMGNKLMNERQTYKKEPMRYVEVEI